MTWFWLTVAIVTEVAATMLLRQSNGFSQLWPSIAVALGYTTAFYALSQALIHGMAIATAYAIWCGIGITLIAILGALLFNEQPTAVQVVGIALIAVGIVILQLGGAHNSATSATAPTGSAEGTTLTGAMLPVSTTAVDPASAAPRS